MSLPPRPPVGLPNGPARARSRHNEPYLNSPMSVRQERTPSLPRQVRPQKSAPSLPRQRLDHPAPFPPARAPPPSTNSRRAPVSYRSSADSQSSSISSQSIFDHVRSTSGYASSVTSYEEEEQRRPYHSKSQSLRTRPTPRYSSPPPDEVPPLPKSSLASGEGDGSSIWNKFTIAASALTVNVSKAWASNIAIASGEVTPPGQESRLTRAMKAYHLEKARNLSDLPSWLFDEHERLPKQKAAGGESSSYDLDRAESSGRTMKKSRGLRDIYDSVEATSTTPTTRRPEASSRFKDYDDPQPSKATDRLRALRDAKRSALKTPNNQSQLDDAVNVAGVEGDGQRFGARIGLPSRPATSSRCRHYQ